MTCFEFGKWFKDFSIFSSGHHIVQLSTFCAILIEGITCIWNNCVKLV